MTQAAAYFIAALAVAVPLAAQAPPQGSPGRGPSGVVGGKPRVGPPGGFIMIGPRPDMLIKGAPYSGVETREVQQRLPNGNRIELRNSTKYYRDGQGRMRIEPGATTDPVKLPTVSFIEIFDPVAGVTWMLDPSTMTARKSPYPPPRPQLSPGRKRPEAQTREEDLGTKVIDNMPTTGKRTTRTIPAGAIGNRQPITTVMESWTSTALKVGVLMKRSDPRFGDTIMRLTEIKLGEPDPSLFKVPANYKVITGGARPQGVVGGVMSQVPVK